MATINDLSDAILCEIFLYINVIERQSLEIVCKQWRKVVRHIWSMKTKLIFNLEPDGSLDEYEVEETHDCIELTTTDMSDVLGILNICDGNLKDLEINDEASPPVGMQTMIVPLRKHKDLNSFKIVSDNEEVVERFLHYLPTESLRELSITFYYESCDRIQIDVVERVNEILMEAQALKSLHLIGFDILSTTLKAIEKLSNLEHLEFGCVENSSEVDNPTFNTKQFGNLESLSICDENMVDDNFLKELVKNCQKLLVLKIHSELLTDDSFEIMKSLPNMRCILVG